MKRYESPDFDIVRLGGAEKIMDVITSSAASSQSDIDTEWSWGGN